jgi:hypothetical protein
MYRDEPRKTCGNMWCQRHDEKVQRKNLSQKNNSMHQEISIATEFLASYLPEEERELFRSILNKQLTLRFQGHWYPTSPLKGSAYRSIKLLHKLDSILHFKSPEFNFNLSSLPKDTVLWIDPNTVSYRQGSNYIVPLYEGNRTTASKHSYSPPSSSITIKRPPLSPPKNENNSHSRFPLHPINVVA